MGARRKTRASFLDYSLQHHAVHPDNPQAGAGRTVLIDHNLPGGVVHPNLAMTVHEGGVQSEDPADVLMTAAVEQRVGGLGGMAPQPQSPGGWSK